MRCLRIVPVVFLVLILTSCATTGPQTKATSAYEIAGITLKMAYDTIKPTCEAGKLPSEKCAQAQKLYNDARKAYIMAGDVLVVAIETDDLAKKQGALASYQNWVNAFTTATSNLVKLLGDWGLLKGGK